MVADGTASCLPEDHAMTMKNTERFFGVVSSIGALTALWAAPQAGLAAAE
jgi:hypothetical protein